MKRKKTVFFKMLGFKNRQIRRERERAQAQEWTNRILSAYLSILIDESGSVRVPRELVRSAIGNYRAEVKHAGDDYLITVVYRPDCDVGNEKK